MRPLQYKKAKVAKPIGHQMMKETIISAIHAGLPMSSSLSAKCICVTPYVNVSYIHTGAPL
jgi:hypothetical protein